MHWTQVLVVLTFVVTFGAFAILLVVVGRRAEENPLGQARGHRLEKLSSSLATLLLLLTGVAYVIDARSVDWFIRIGWLDTAAVRGVGLAACVLANALLIWGEASLGRSFRVALPERREPLVKHGIYRWVRNPLALSIDLLSLGLPCLAPSCVAAAAFTVTVVAYELKIRAEEQYLRRAHGPAYAAYCARSGRYFPRIFRKRSWRSPR